MEGFHRIIIAHVNPYPCRRRGIDVEVTTSCDKRSVRMRIVNYRQKQGVCFVLVLVFFLFWWEYYWLY